MAALTYMDDWFGLLDPKADLAYIIDNFGNAVRVPWSMPLFWHQEH